MPIGRMNREQFFGQLATLDEQRLKKALWNLYWRGAAATRERIEAEIDPDQHDRGKRLSKQPADPQQLLGEVGDFVALARSGAYLAGDRRVSPRERSWRSSSSHLTRGNQRPPNGPRTASKASSGSLVTSTPRQTLPSASTSTSTATGDRRHRRALCGDGVTRPQPCLPQGPIGASRMVMVGSPDKGGSSGNRPRAHRG